MKILSTILLLTLIACTLEDPKEGVSTKDVIAWKETSELEILANNQDKLELVALLKRTNPNLEVTFTTDQGYFAGAKESDKPKELKLAASGKIASVKLVANQVPNEEVTITASVGNFRIERFVLFKPAYPDGMVIETDRDSVDVNQVSYANIFLKLFRADGAGKVSDNLRISLTQVTIDGDGILEVTPFVSTVSEGASFRVRSQNKKKGVVRITASIKQSNSEVLLSKEIEIDII